MADPQHPSSFVFLHDAQFATLSTAEKAIYIAAAFEELARLNRETIEELVRETRGNPR